MFMDQVKSYCNDKTKVKMTVPKTAHLYQLENGKLGSSLDEVLHISPGTLELEDYTKKTFILKNKGLECKNYSGAVGDAETYPAYKYQVQNALPVYWMKTWYPHLIKNHHNQLISPPGV